MAEQKELLDLHWLFLPLLGGYVFYTRFSALSFFAARCNGQRLLFHAGTVALALLIVAHTVVLADRWVPPVQSEIVHWISNAVMGAALTVLVALWMIFVDSRRIATLGDEFRHQRYKPGMGYVLGVLSIAVFASTFFLTTKHDINSLLGITVAGCAICFASCCGALLLSYWHRRLELDNRQSGTLLRVSLLLLMTSQLALIWITTADVMDEYWHRLAPWENSGTAFLACLLGLVSWWPLNLLISNEAAGAHLHRNKRTSALERFLYIAQVQKALVQITLRDGKVYVGWIQDLPPNPGAPDSFIQVLPVRSGFRDRRTKDIEFTTDYAEYYKKQSAPIETNLFIKLVPMPYINSASRYIEIVFQEFASLKRPAAQPASSSSLLNQLAKLWKTIVGK